MSKGVPPFLLSCKFWKHMVDQVEPSSEEHRGQGVQDERSIEYKGIHETQGQKHTVVRQDAKLSTHPTGFRKAQKEENFFQIAWAASKQFCDIIPRSRRPELSRWRIVTPLSPPSGEFSSFRLAMSLALIFLLRNTNPTSTHSSQSAASRTKK